MHCLVIISKLQADGEMASAKLHEAKGNCSESLLVEEGC